MESTSSTVPAEQPAGRVAAGSLAWALAWVVITGAVVALGMAVRAAVFSGDYRSLITHQTLTPLITTGFAVLGALVASRRWRNPIGWIFLAVALLFALTALAATIYEYGYPLSRLRAWAEWFGAWIWIPAVALPFSFVLLLFPDGQLPSPRWRFIGWSVALGLALSVLKITLHPGPVWGQPLSPFGILGPAPVLDVLLDSGSVLLGAGLLGSLAAFAVRFRRSAGIQREQMKWLVYAVGLNLLCLSLSSLAWVFWPGSPLNEEIAIVINNLGILGIAVAAAIAILRYRLYDIDLIINRTFVYTALSIGVVTLYGLVVGGLGALFQASGNALLSLLATGLAAILVQPARERLQHLVNRLMYGERDDPYAILSGLTRQLEGSLAPEAALPAVVQAVAQALKIPYVAIALKREGNFEVAASYGSVGNEWIQLPLIYQGEMIGQLRLSTRSPREPFTPGEQRLLRDLARQIGVAAHTVRLAEDLRRLADDLQRSRQELVRSREDERRRLRRDLHDELGPQLASLKLNLDVARNLVSRNPAAAEALLLNLRAHSQSLIADIRRLVSDLRPPSLDELGLVGAIQEYTRQVESREGLCFHIDSPKSLPPLPAAVEVAAYRIALEALANVVRHSQASHCQISISALEQNLQVEICDDGLGLSGHDRPGVGLASMRERAVELGGTCLIEALPQGGTRVLARLPLD